MEDKNVKFLEYLQVCGQEYVTEDDFDTVRGKACDFRKYYEFMEKGGEVFEEIIENYYDLVDSLNDKVEIYDKILDISKKMDDIHKKFITSKGDFEASRRLSCIADELRLGKKNIIKNWSNLSRLYVGPYKAKINNRFYKMYPKTLEDENMMTIMTFRSEKLKGVNIGAIIYKDNQELVYKADKIGDILTIASMIKKLNFEYDLVALAPCFTDVFFEFEQYLVGMMSKADFDGEVKQEVFNF